MSEPALTLDVAPATDALCFHVPPCDDAEFASLPNSRRNPLRDDVRYRLVAMKRLHDSPVKLREAKALAAAWNRRRGFKPNTLLRLYYEFITSGDWRVLVDRHRAGKAWRIHKGSADDHGIAGRPEFITEFKRRCEENQRCIAGAIRSLRADLRAWRRGDRSRAIPGYDRPPADDPATGLPHGWNEGNLYRYAPTKIELAAARIGPVAASAHRLPVLLTRAGLSVGEYVLFDDHEFNLKVNFPGQTRAMRPLMFAALDLYSGCICGQGFRPTLWDAKLEKKSVLKEEDFRWFVIHHLLTRGYRTVDGKKRPGTTLVVEHGTAKLRDWFIEKLDYVTRGQVGVETSGKFSEPILAGLFPGQVRGNFRFKAALESMFNRVDNEFAALPGQVGKGRDFCPEELDGRDRENDKLLAAEEAMGIELIKPFWNWDAFIQRALDGFAAINGRTDHNLEGWRKCGHVVDEWRPSAAVEAWHPMALLEDFSAEERAATHALLRVAPHLTRTRNLAPAEVYDAGRTGLTKLSLVHLPDLVGDEPGHVCRVDKGVFRMQREEHGELMWHATVHGQQLPQGEKFELFFDPFAPDAAVVTDAARKVIGVAPAYRRVSRSDEEGVKALLGTASHWQAEALADVKARHGRIAREETARRAENARRLNGGVRDEEVFKPASVDEYESARARRREAAKTARALSVE